MYRYCAFIKWPSFVQGRQITTRDLEETGHYFCQALSHLKSSLAEEAASEKSGTLLQKEREETQSASSSRYIHTCIHVHVSSD